MKDLLYQRSVAVLSCLIISILVVSGSYKAHAASQTLPFDFPVPELGSLIWTDIGDEAFCFGEGVTALNINDAIDSIGNTDAYDTAWNTSINGTPVSPNGIGDLTGRTYTSAPQNISGLDVTYQLYFSQDTQCNRLVLFFDNATGSTINETVRIETNFGSDGDTQIDGTSSGDLNFTTADRWLVTSDDGPSDPVLTNVFYGPGSPAVTTSFASLEHCPADGPLDDGFAVEFNITVPQNQSRCLMLFGCLADITGPNNTVSGALAAAPLFNSNDTIPGDLLSGLSEAELANCVNWDFQGSVPVSAQVPTLSEWGLIFIAVLLGIVGFIVIRRRKATA